MIQGSTLKTVGSDDEWIIQGFNVDSSTIQFVSKQTPQNKAVLSAEHLNSSESCIAVKENRFKILPANCYSDARLVCFKMSDSFFALKKPDISAEDYYQKSFSERAELCYIARCDMTDHEFESVKSTLKLDNVDCLDIPVNQIFLINGIYADLAQKLFPKNKFSSFMSCFTDKCL